MNELKPCPFCGGEVKIDKDDFYMFCCDKCGAGITFAKVFEDGTAGDCDELESITAWNRRPAQKPFDTATAREMIEALYHGEYDNEHIEQGAYDTLIDLCDAYDSRATPENKPLTLEHVDCKTCQFEGRQADEEPCRHCKGAYPSRYARKPQQEATT